MLEGTERRHAAARAAERAAERAALVWILVWRSVALAACALATTSAAPAGAFSWFDGKLEMHGYFAESVRVLGNDLDPDEEFDLAQWYHVLNLEFEAKPFPNGIGPLEIVEFYVRAEARYDCVWTRGCGMFPSVNTYGNRAEHLPPRLIDGDQPGWTGTLRNGDTRPYSKVNRENYELANRGENASFDQRPLRFDELPGFVNLFGNSRGPNQVFEPIGPDFGDDSAPFLLDRVLSRCKFGARNTRGGEDDAAFELIGPWNPGCPIDANGALRHKPNPFRFADFNPLLAGVDRIPGTGDEPMDRFTGAPIIPGGRGELPFRPAPFFGADARGLELDEAQGLYLPSAALVRELRSGNLDSIDQNFGQQELAWNRGASQSDERELKEAYVDIEAAEGRLWLRIGKQTIVWGKTELFRNTDQFNPQDFALASLPGLEESRIALWSARGTWSFYNVGKLEDVRLELAVNFDDFEPADLGRCGEPFALEVVCNIAIGYFAHGLTGVGLAGNDKPEAPWNDVAGLEGGARLEWRYKRFSFQLSDFYGYDDFPYPRRISTYARNVDPRSGRPRKLGARGDCSTGGEKDCLGRPNSVAMGSDGQPLRVVDSDLDGIPDTVLERTGNGNLWGIGDLIVDPAHKRDVLALHSANQTTYAFANAGTCGNAGRPDPALCGFVAFNGKGGPGAPASTLASGASALIAGSRNAALSAVNNEALCNLPLGTPSAACSTAFSSLQVLLNRDPGDGVGVFSDGGVSLFSLSGQTMGQTMTPWQEALFGCGPFYQSDCDVDGIDMLNAEASVLVQSWPGFDGTRGSVDFFDSADGSIWQPGTVGFRGGPVATRYVDGEVVILPGARGPTDPGYDPTVDGCVGPAAGHCTAARALVHPYTGQPWRSELAAASWNFLLTVAAGGRLPNDVDRPTISEFDPFDPYGLGVITHGPFTGQLRPGVDPARVDGATPVACGLRLLALCRNVQGFLGGLGARRNSVKAAGKHGFGRRDFPWHSGGEIVLDYEKRNVLGFAFDFDEDRTKSNWGVEATWVNKQPFVNNDEFDGVSKVDTLNLTVSVDRPTFINFLNPGRTFFINAQFFLQYITDYGDDFYTNGPLNLLGTLTAFTGYFQDRLMVFNTVVYDVRSRSGALLPSMTYRFTENFSTSIGVNVFWGRTELRDAPVNEIRPALNRVGSHAYEDAVVNGLSALRERDEVWFGLRYTF
ncbi:MAG: hypothetical protein DCC71_19635 [Proteobacteria bacterium]|nr:MAG: hypothetical protein DCC71_19635 [Pseudomonadota bacterium]